MNTFTFFFKSFLKGNYLSQGWTFFHGCLWGFALKKRCRDKKFGKYRVPNVFVEEKMTVDRINKLLPLNKVQSLKSRSMNNASFSELFIAF